MADFNVNKRLRIIIDDIYKVSPIEFAKKYDDKKAVKTYNILSERNGFSNKMLDTIVSAYPEINKSWLLTGEGEPIKKFPIDQIVCEPNSQESKYFSNDLFYKLIETNSMLVTTNSKLVDQQEKIIAALNEITTTNAKLAKAIKKPEHESEESINGAAKTA